MKRRVLNLLTALSLPLCVAAGVLWARSHRTCDLMFWTSGDCTCSFRVVAGSGGIGVVLDREVAGDEVGKPGWHWHAGAASGYARGGWRHRAGFALSGEPGGFAVAVPFWFVCAGLATAALPGTLALARRRRRIPGTCPTCGYDLRATPERCPECGRAPAHPA